MIELSSMIKYESNFLSKDIANKIYEYAKNNDDNLSITDVYVIYMKIIGVAWKSGVVNYRIFTQTEWSTISTSTSNLKSTYSGTQTITVNGLTNKGSSNYYLVRTGYRF